MVAGESFGVVVVVTQDAESLVIMTEGKDVMQTAGGGRASTRGPTS